MKNVYGSPGSPHSATAGRCCWSWKSCQTSMCTKSMRSRYAGTCCSSTSSTGPQKRVVAERRRAELHDERPPLAEHVADDLVVQASRSGRASRGSRRSGWSRRCRCWLAGGIAPSAGRLRLLEHVRTAPARCRLGAAGRRPCELDAPLARDVERRRWRRRTRRCPRRRLAGACCRGACAPSTFSSTDVHVALAAQRARAAVLADQVEAQAMDGASLTRSLRCQRADARSDSAARRRTPPSAGTGVPMRGAPSRRSASGGRRSPSPVSHRRRRRR